MRTHSLLLALLALVLAAPPTTTAAPASVAQKDDFARRLSEARLAVTRNQHAQAERALLELVADKSARPEQQRAATMLLVDCYLRQQKHDEALKLNSPLLAQGRDANEKAAVMLQNARIYTAMKPPRRDQADALLKAVVNDPAVAVAQRASAYHTLTQALLAGKSKAEKKQVIELAKGILADPAIGRDDFYRVQTQVIKAATALEDVQTMLAAASAIRSSTICTNAQKISATWSIVEHEMLSDRIDQAQTLVREPLGYAGLSNDDLFAAYSNIGKTLEWQGKCDEAIAAYRQILAQVDTPPARLRVAQLSADALMSFNRHEEAARLFRDLGKPMDEAKVYSRSLTPEKARPIALAVLEDAGQPEPLRRQAYEFFLGALPRNREVAEKYLAFYLDDFGPRASAAPFFHQARGAMMTANYDYALRCLEIARRTASYKNDFLAVVYQVNALAGLGRCADAAALAKEYAAYADFKPPQRYQMALTAEMLLAPEAPDAIEKALRAVDAGSDEFKRLDGRMRAEALLKTGRSAMIANKDAAAKAIHAAYEKLFVPQPRKLYTVTFSPTPISGLASWASLRPQPPKQLLDRAFGGNMDFLATDVATGERGAGIGSENAGQKNKFTEFAAACDASGFHFVFTAHDERAREVEAKLTGAGSYESYLAPGPNQPYTCLLTDLQSGQVNLWNTTYNNEQHRRIEDRPAALRSEHVFTDTGYQTYLFIAWDAFYDKLPDADDRWDFETIHWGRAGGYSWNGTRSIHGRSTWGSLGFAIPAKGMAAIKRKLVFAALARYQAEKSTKAGHQGVIDFWKDDAIGDSRFYAQVLAPYLEKLDAHVPKAKIDMSDADVESLFAQAVPAWNEIVFKIAELRRQYLEELLCR